MPSPASAARERLAASRGALLAALEPLTERDFARRTERGEQVAVELVRFAAQERRFTARLTATPSGAPPDATAGDPTLDAEFDAGLNADDDPGDGPDADAGARLLPPQAVHQLAGARYTTEALLTRLADEHPDDPAIASIARAYEALAERERELAARIARLGATTPRL